MPNLSVFNLAEYFAQLTLDNGCLPVKVDASFWEHGIAELPPGRLVSMVESDADWLSWERHPNGEEMIIQLSGQLILILESNGSIVEQTLEEGDFVIVPRGVWHTANVSASGRALFITPGDGTENRPRA